MLWIPNSLNLDPVQEFYPNLDPDAELCGNNFEEKECMNSLKKQTIFFFKNILLTNYKKIMALENIFSQLRF